MPPSRWSSDRTLNYFRVRCISSSCCPPFLPPKMSKMESRLGSRPSARSHALTHDFDSCAQLETHDRRSSAAPSTRQQQCRLLAAECTTFTTRISACMLQSRHHSASRTLSAFLIPYRRIALQTQLIHASLESCSRLTDELIQAYGLYAHMTVCTYGKYWGALSEQEIGKFHTDAYLQFLQQIEYNGHEIIDEAASFVLNNSVIACFVVDACFKAFQTTRERRTWICRTYSQIYAGGSVAAASSLTRGQADVAINWIGGQTHARRDCASGFSYVNDVVLAVLALLPAYERVLFVNIDACHSSGVEEAFFTTVHASLRIVPERAMRSLSNPCFLQISPPTSAAAHSATPRSLGMAIAGRPSPPLSLRERKGLPAASNANV
eukprot:4778431-Pleurochrysis_carterae.AAC.1